ncbi:MAG TPA: hypothetical protein VMD59_18455, partial [Acidimicrobiales bacterium]|nr:hypothetical protein [Acidimicrobiales bacterium]
MSRAAVNSQPGGTGLRGRPWGTALVVAAVAAVIAGGAGTLALFGSAPTEASVGNNWAAGATSLPASDPGGNGPATGDEAAVPGQVACPTAGRCFVVGGYLDSAGNSAAVIETVIETAPGSVAIDDAVAPEPATNPSGNVPQSSGSANLFAQLYSVSCASASFCVAVGVYQDSAGGDWALIETWQGGSSWTPSVAPEPASNNAEFGPGTGARQVAALWDVDCYGVGDCVAVGSYGDSDGHAWPMIDTLLQGSWSATTVDVADQAVGADAESSWLSVVSCAPNGFCAAGGAYNDQYNSANWGVLATGWDGHWVSASALPPAASDAWASGIDAVACPPTGHCVALGVGGNDTLIAYTEDGEDWSSSVVPLPAGNSAGTPTDWGNDYFSISCPANGACIATGNVNASWEATIITQSAGGFTTALAPSPSGE